MLLLWMLQNTPHEVYVHIGCASKLYLCEGLCFVWCRSCKTRCVFKEKSETCYCLRVLLGGKLCFVDHNTVTIPYLTVVRNTVANQLGSECLSWMQAGLAVVFKKNLNAAKPPEQSKGLGGKIGCKVKKNNQHGLDLMSIPQSGGKHVKTIRCVLPSTTGDFDGNLRTSVDILYTGCGSGWCNKASSEYHPDRQGK